MKKSKKIKKQISAIGGEIASFAKKRWESFFGKEKIEKEIIQSTGVFTLKIKNLVKIYKKKRVVNDISFEIKKGEVVGILGPNGAGKTTCFYMTVGLIKPDEGKVYINDTDITKLPMYKRAKLGVGYLPQEASIFRKMTVEDNIISTLEALGYSRDYQKKRSEELMRNFKVMHISKQYGYTLSGGERRRVEIARALAANPKILLLDEPFAGVDPIAIQDIQSVIRDVQKLQVGILITDHNVRETLKIVSRAYILAEGQILIKGTAKQLTKSKLARKSYLGENFSLN